ncbi:hypothetical protein [Burkholderia cepacia]|uniref:hypothetical protein n=1 Tax=Burkholderia cepacia TaxID=292 RepID=UPI0012D8D753|nr:hypothetical protein [Burkholderia cepacia]
MRKAFVGLLMLAGACTAAYPARVVVPNGFYTGNSYQAFLPLERERYVAGVLDGLLSSPLMANANVPLAGILQKGSLQLGLNTAQATAIVEK